jgi:micrococcal nuclease
MRSFIIKVKSELFLIFVLLGGSLLFCISYPASRQRALVITVYDGDTLKVKFSDGRSEIVRLIGVDAPELNDIREGVLFWAMISKRFTFTFLYRKEVWLEYDREPRDRHGRLLAYVFIGGSLFNEIMIRRGYAHAFLKYRFRMDYRLRFAAAEQESRDARRGLWGLWRDTSTPPASPAEAKRHVGETMQVRFVCGRVEKLGTLVFLRARDADFAALIERRDLDRFPPLRKLVGRTITVLGLVEEYRGHPQMFLFLPLQLQHSSPWEIPLAKTFQENLQRKIMILKRPAF